MDKVDIGNYIVFSNGQIISKRNRGGYLKGWDNGKGYNYIKIDDVSKARHSVVAKAFLGEKKKGFTVNHKDGNKLNNDISNLEYISFEDNYNHALDTGLKRNVLNSLGLDACSDMVEFYENTNVSIRELSRITGFSRSAINPILSESFKKG